LLGKYVLGRKTWRYTQAILGGILRQEYPHVDHREYPAHLHVNVEAAMRGQGIGQRLMEAYLEQIRQLGVPGVFLNTTTVNKAAIRLYERQGFQLLENRRMSVWSYLMERPVENCCFGLQL
jgi:ribosomal protein S18 acetylase RimI-like enzyme